MSENPKTDPDLGDELRDLGKNLSDFLRAAWASDGRKQVQKDVESSLSELGETINKAASDFSASDTGQRLKSDFHDLRQKVETGEVPNRARQELLAALKRANAELTKAANKWGPTSTGQEPSSGVDENSNKSA